MPLKPIRYPFDKTGISPDNKVVNETRNLKPTKIRCFVTDNGGFFTESFVLRDAATNQVLRKGSQYEFDNLYPMATEHTRKEVAGLVVITDSKVSNNISYDYQAVGGLYGYSNEALLQQIEALKLDSRPIEWGNILNKPDVFPPAPHLQDIGDIYGFEYIVHALQQLRHAILTGDEGSHTVIYEYIDRMIANIKPIVDNLKDLLSAHVMDKNNPHGTTAEQVGAYTKAAVDGLLKVIRDALTAHENNKNNPHGITPAIIGTYTKKQIDDFLSAVQQSIGDVLERHIRDKLNPHGTTAAQVGAFTKAETQNLINGVQNALNAFIARRDNPHGVTATQTGAYTKAETNNEIDKYVKSKLVDNRYKLLENVIPISTAPYNQLRWNNNGLYYGNAPDASTANLYVDAVNGVDVVPTLENKAGTRDNPLKTVQFAIRAGGIGSNRGIHVMENQTHIIDCSGDTPIPIINNSEVRIYNYGTKSDVVPMVPGNNRHANPLMKDNAATLKFVGMKIAPSGTADYISLNAFGTSGTAHILFYGLKLVREIPDEIFKSPLPLSSAVGIISHFGAVVNVTFLNCRIQTGKLKGLNAAGKEVIRYCPWMVSSDSTVQTTANIIYRTITDTTGEQPLVGFWHRSVCNVLLGNKNEPGVIEKFMEYNRNNQSSFGRWDNFNANFDAPIDMSQMTNITWENNRIMAQVMKDGKPIKLQIWPAQWADTVDISKL